MADPAHRVAPAVPAPRAPAPPGAASSAGGRAVPVRIRVRRPALPLDSSPDASNTPSVDDPLVAALAQLVRDRWAAERRERAAARARLRVVEAKR